MSNEEKKNNISKLSSNNILDNQINLKQSTNSIINVENEKSYFTYEELFTINDIKEINESANPKGTISTLIEKFLEKKKGKVEIQSNLLMSQAEFHLNNLNFLQENFKNFPLEIICKILNLLSNLLNLEEEKYNINLPKTSIFEDNEMKKYGQVPEPDFSFICRKKLEELKEGFKFLGFFPTREEILEQQKKLKMKIEEENKEKEEKKEEEEKVEEEKKEEEKTEEKKKEEKKKEEKKKEEKKEEEKKEEEKKEEEKKVEEEKKEEEEKIEKFYLNTKELQTILDYLKQFYFPFIRLFYHFINIDRITETKKVEVIINRPLPVPPLCEAVEQKLEKNIIDEKKEEEEVENEENENDKNEENREGDDANKDMMNQININNEIRKLVTEKVNELRKDVDARISDNENEIKRQVEEIKESANPKKK